MRYFWMILIVATMVGCGAVYEKDTDKTEDFCASDYQRCNGACVSLMSDSHCGKCGEACGDNASCFKDDQGNYACQCATGYATCASDECAIDVTTDISHCGGCFNKCGQDEECVGGECVCNSLTRENKVLASDADRAQAYASELANCGQCGYDCKAVSVDNDRCVEGHCRCAGDGTSCVEGDGCSVDLNSDPKNCGQCGHECEAAANCIDGKCGCATGQVYCDGECVDNNDEHCGDGCLKCLDNTECNVKTNACLCSDPDAFIKRKACLIGDNIYGCVKLGTDQNCADCGNICMGGTTCQSGQCKCREGYALCGSKNCLNIQTDPLHCGECHNACQKSTPHCVAGQCRPCAANQIDCGNGKCVPDTLTGNAICMACGIGHHIDTKTGKIVEGCGFGQECHWNSKVGKYACFCDNHACQPYSMACVDSSDAKVCGCELLDDGKVLCKRGGWPRIGDSCDVSGKCLCQGKVENLCLHQRAYCIGNATEPCLSCPSYESCLDDADPSGCVQALCDGIHPDCMGEICAAMQ